MSFTVILACRQEKGNDLEIKITYRLVSTCINLLLSCSAGHRFHNPATEPDMPYDVVPPFDDSVMLAVDDYRRRLRQVSTTFSLHAGCCPITAA